MITKFDSLCNVTGEILCSHARATASPKKYTSLVRWIHFLIDYSLLFDGEFILASRRFSRYITIVIDNNEMSGVGNGKNL
jgi:hypothetical protein